MEDLTPEQRKKIYEEEKARLENPESDGKSDVVDSMDNPKQASGITRTTVEKMLGLSIVVILGIVALSQFSGTHSTPQAPEHAPATPWGTAATPLNVTAVKLVSAYQANEVSADDKYKGRLVKVSGIVKEVSKDAMDNVVVTVGDENGYDPTGVMCRFTHPDAIKSQLAALQKGQSIDIVGTVSGMLVGQVIVDCN
jgi:hypothetical protein